MPSVWSVFAEMLSPVLKSTLGSLMTFEPVVIRKYLWPWALAIMILAGEFSSDGRAINEVPVVIYGVFLLLMFVLGVGMAFAFTGISILGEDLFFHIVLWICAPWALVVFFGYAYYKGAQKTGLENFLIWWDKHGRYYVDDDDRW